MRDEQPRKRKHPSSVVFTAFDRDLIHACKEHLTVILEMGEGTRFTGEIIQVDKYFIKIRDMGGAEEVERWINKSALLTATIHPRLP